MTELALTAVDWPAAIRAADRLGPLPAAEIVSLSALFEADYGRGLAAIARASAADPFNPLHQVRLALHYARFGDIERATAVLQALQQLELKTPLFPYLRALLALRGGRPEQARALAASLETSYPDFAAGKFLRAETQIINAQRGGNLERYLRPLPQEPRWAACWADLLVKLALLHPAEGPALAARYAKRAGEGTPARAAVDKALAWVAAPADAFSELIGQETPGSRAEALLLECLVDKLERWQDEPTGEAAAAGPAAERAMTLLAGLAARHPDRGALRQVQHAFAARRATALTAEGRPAAAMRFVERCLAAEPYNLTYHQNRAALFTLMRSGDAYHEAWAALNASQYRLLLLGETDASVLGAVVKTHRLFAQQARGGAERMGRAVFRRVEHGEGEPTEQMNNDTVGSDPDLLRQWFHHQRAQLLFRHLMLGDGERLLLSPQDRDEASARGDALAAIATSLPVLVAEEGALLAEQLAPRWRAAAEGARTRWQPQRATEATEGEVENDAAADPPVAELQAEHLTTLADLCLIALEWQPRAEHLWIAEELLAWALTEVAFAEARRLGELERELGHKTQYSLRMLASRVRGVAKAADAGLAQEAVRPAVEQCLAELLRTMALVSYEAGDSGKERADRAVAYIERARAYDRANPSIELLAAELLSVGEYYDAAREALARFRRLASPEMERLSTRADDLAATLREHHQKGEKGRGRDAAAETEIHDAGDAERVAELMREIDAAPASWRLYAALVRELQLADRFEEAVVWADRCVSHCLSRNEQINARSLAIEARGVQTLAATTPRAAKLYAVGGHEPARRAIDALAVEGGPLDFSLYYLRGRCLLTAGQPEAASAAFSAALAACEAALYRTVLRRLTGDIDQAYLDVARGVIDDTVRDEDYDEAVAEGLKVLGRLKAPAAWLVDLARVFCQAAVGRLAQGGAASTIRAFELVANWRPRLDEALGRPSDAERAAALAELAEALHPASAAQAQALLVRARWLRRQAAVAAALAQAGELLAARRFDATLAMMDALAPDLAAEPRLKRLRILALLGAHRFQEADAEVQGFGEAGSADLRAFLESYPALAFRQRIALAQTMLREGRARETLDALKSLAAPGPQEALELGYCRSFATALEAYELRRDRDAGGARRKFEAALLLLEPHMRGAAVPAYVSELFDRLDKEVEQHVG